ncbi:GATA zinc finger domain-containing protein 1 [Schistocerca nitens]|uniref:GATA zinc finger domain-containing protein 1 n=1 Tax=Schistocerca nitens TaxID=7011 RepID=UPI0021180976|nr:GATA zinc finger domain-containing protein 1 [Schistocerca nitens]
MLDDTMPLGIKPECYKCNVTESKLWKQTADGFVCVDCCDLVTKTSCPPKNEDIASQSSKSQETAPRIATRKSRRSTRNYKTRLNPYALPKPLTPKGKGRRVIFKKTPTKAPTAVATPVTSNYVFYKGSYFQVGDIVSVQDIDGGLYYAQIRGLLTDQYCEKSCVLTWLIPTTASPDPNEGFDPSTYIIGPDEELPRLLSCMEFVMHAPSDYYKNRKSPYPSVDYDSNDPNFIWTRLPTYVHKL